MNTGISKETLIKDFSKSLRNGNASLFIGAGLSRSANYVGWKDVLRECAIEIGLDVDKENDLITLAQYYVRENQRTKITETIKEFFSDSKGACQETHRIIATLPLHDIWTTNYDTLLERAFNEAGIKNTIITDDDSYKNIDRTACVKIHKIHGCVKVADKCIIARKDYDTFPQTHDIVLSELKGEMCSNSFLFLGYSFSDTDIQHILTQIRLEYENNHPQRHYCIMEKVYKGSNESHTDYEYRKNHQNHYVSDMQSYGINVLLVDSYDEIEDILRQIRDNVYAKCVMVSGAYEETDLYAKRISDITIELCSNLIQKGFKIHTGYGKNLGPKIIEGAYDGCTKINKGAKDFNSNVAIFPFPYRKNRTKSRDKLYADIRRHMVSLTKILIIIAGKKQKHNSEGVFEEYKYAFDNNNLIIPIATTGGTAQQIWDELNNNKDYSCSKNFQKLNTEVSPIEITKIVFEFISEMQGE